MREAVGRDQLNAAVFRPAGSAQRLQQTCGRALADSYAAGDADDIRNLLPVGAGVQYRLPAQVGTL